ncbi:MAG: ATP synthase subunit I [Proteobacteria bacterium]|nr:ATP synthase subunit I [Pseudomonadota bacterium]
MQSRKLIIDTSQEDLHSDLEAGLRKKLVRVSIVIFVLMVTFSFAFLTQKTAAGVAAGGVLALFCFIEMKRSLEKTFAFLHSGKDKVAVLKVVGRYNAKLAFVTVFLVILLKGEKVGAAGLAIGLLVVPATVIYTAISLYLNNLKANAR